MVISGLGSDELLGGYGRHRSVFKSGGWPAVISEVRRYKSYHYVFNPNGVEKKKIVAGRDRPYTDSEFGKR